jgi:hypothetical protein
MEETLARPAGKVNNNQQAKANTQRQAPRRRANLAGTLDNSQDRDEGKRHRHDRICQIMVDRVG